MSAKWIIHENVPRWYELALNADQSAPGVLLRLDTDYISKTETHQPTNQFIKEFEKDLRIGDFRNQWDKDFGFEGALIHRGIKDNFTEFLVPFPLSYKMSADKCDECDGTGQSSFGDEVCIFCGGDGKDYYYDYHHAYCISATLTVLSTLLLRFPDRETTSQLPQLLNFYTITLADQHGGSIGGAFSLPLVQWLSKFPNRTMIKEMVDAMELAWKTMMKNIRWNGSFLAYVNDKGGWLNVSCPGDACGLHPSRSLDEGSGYEFACHNVDSPVQQLTLLAGLAALHERADREIQASPELNEKAKIGLRAPEYFEVN